MAAVAAALGYQPWGSPPAGEMDGRWVGMERSEERSKRTSTGNKEKGVIITPLRGSNISHAPENGREFILCPEFFGNGPDL